jgi:hypothetical protein
MEKNILEEEKKLIQNPGQPTVSVISPFEPKVISKLELLHKLKISLHHVEKELSRTYSHDKVKLVMGKLQHIIDHLNFNTHKKSLAIFVSPLTEKVYYLDVEVEEKIAIDTTFEIRDLINNKKGGKEYLILLLSGKFSKIYLADHGTMRVIKSNVAENIYAYQRDMPERVPHFDDPHALREIEIDKFLLHIDDGLSSVVQAYPFPVFVVGVERLLGHFRKISKNVNSIVAYIHGNYEEFGENEIKELVEPYVADLNKARKADLYKQIEDAMSERKLVYGIRDVTDAASHKNCKLLIVEKDFICPAHKDDRSRHDFYINDLVGHVIEKVLDGGGDVELVDNDSLKEYQHIALIEHY